MLTAPLVGFAVFTFVCYLLFRLGDSLAPKLTDQGAKLAQYACGEDFPARKLQVGYTLFFRAALFFTMMHVAALVVATLPSGSMALAGLGALYLLMITLSIMTLMMQK
jgi:NADH:ubiquinone oxidoreductase subunit 3 (subunit A)